MIHFPHHFPHFFKQKLPLQLEELFITVGLMDFASAAITLFEPIYLWTLGYRIPEIMLFYVMVYVPYYFLAPLGGKFVARIGPERSILFSTVWLVGYVVALIGIGNVPGMLYVAPLLFALQKTFYWPAYHFQFMRFSAKSERAAEFSGLWTLSTVMYILGPIIGGLVVKFFGFTTFFLGAAVIIFVSSAPLFYHVPEPKRENYSYWRSLILPFRRRYARSTAGYLGLGEELIGLTAWPIFFFLVYADVLKLGFLVGFSAWITSMLTLFFGKLSDRFRHQRMLRISALVQSLTWWIRLGIRGTVPVFLTDVAGRSVHNSTFVSLTALTYDRAHKDDYSWHGVYYEQGFALAKSLAAVAVMLLAIVVDPFQAAFIVAAVMSLFFLVF